MINADARRHIQAYRAQHIEGKTKEELVLAAFELGMKGCRKHDRELVRDVLLELIAGLDFSHRDIAGNFLVLYDYAMREVREGKFDNSYKIFDGLHSAWDEALKRKRAPGGQEISLDEKRSTKR